MSVAALVAACHSKACAPPPVGTGGSQQGGSGQSGAKPWSRKFVAGQWERVSGSDIRDLLWSNLENGLKDVLDAVPENRREAFRNMLMQETNDQADALVRQGSAIWCNGNVKVIDWETRLTEEGKKNVLETIDRLQTSHPHDADVTLTILESINGGDAYGATRLRMSDDEPVQIMLRANEMNMALESPARMSMNWHQNSIPVRQGVWGIMHEWGHSIDRSKMVPRWKDKVQLMYDEFMQNIVTTGSMSRYARHDAHEMIAEAFADWSLTNGTSTNQITQALGKELEW